MNLALIPARGGSKRLPGKNLVDLKGKPLIAHSIIHALNERSIDEVWVSTDDQDIAEVAKCYGAKVLRRPAKLADDYTPTSEVVKYHVTNLLQDNEKDGWVFILQPTNPVRPDNLLSDALKKVKEKKRTALACFSPSRKKFGKIKDDFFTPESYSFGQRSQDIEGRFYENGLIYLVNISLAKKGVLFPDDLYPFVIDSIHGTVDIDYKEDLDYAKIVIEYLKKKDK